MRRRFACQMGGYRVIQRKASTQFLSVFQNWKCKVCPIFKSGKGNQAENYVLYILSNFSEVSEMVLYEILDAHIKY